MTAKASYLGKAAIAHLLRAAAGVTGRDSFVIIGTGAVIARLKAVPLDLMRTREVDLYVPDDPEADAMSDLIDGTIGEGSPFDETFGYYAHGVGALTACLPDDWRTRAVRYEVPSLPELLCFCPDPDDVALSKLCAWRDKDRAWIAAALGAGVIRLDVMRERSVGISNPNAPAAAEIERRLQVLAERMGPGRP